MWDDIKERSAIVCIMTGMVILFPFLWLYERVLNWLNRNRGI